MLAIFAVLIAKVLDPLSIFVALLLSIVLRRWWHCFVAGVIVAILVETFLTLSQQHTRQWGDGILVGYIASTSHVLLFFWIESVLRRITARRKKTNAQPKTEVDIQPSSFAKLDGPGVSSIKFGDDELGEFLDSGSISRASIEARLTHAKHLFVSGLIDENEYREARTKIISEI